MNKAQRLVVGIAATLVVVLLFLHNPFGGYYYQSTIYGQVHLEGCPMRYSELLLKQAAGTVTEAQQTELRQLGAMCVRTDPSTYELAPLSAWYSEDSVVDSLSYTKNLLWAVALVLVLSVFWFWMLKGQPKSQDSN